jgi:glycosyltransferase involved in cell wall biosynthesis
MTLVAGLEERARKRVSLDDVEARFAPDVVHVHTVVNPSALEWAAERHSVVTVQDHRAFCSARGKWTLGGEVCRRAMHRDACALCFDDAGYFNDIYALTEQRLAPLRRMRSITLSRYMKDELVAVGLPESRVDVIPPFVHGLDANAHPDGPPCVLFVGRLAEGKGARDALLAWRLSGIPLPLVFAGTGPLRAELEASEATVLGWVEHHQLSGLYRRAQALLMPSRWQEPFGIAGLEALTMGTPVVAWDSGGIREWLGDNVSPWGDVAALAGALRQALGTNVGTPCGFDGGALMARLESSYARVIGS